MSGFDPEAYFNNRFAGLVNVDSGEATTEALTSKQAELARASEQRLARLTRIQEQHQYNLENTVVGKLGLNPDRGLGQVVNKVASSFDAVQDFATGVKGAALNGYASLQESVVDEQAKEAHKRYLNNIATPQDQEVLNARPFVPAGGNMSNLERLEHALSIRGVNDSINKATDLESLIAYDIDGNKPSSYQRRIVGDGLITGVKGAVAVPELAVGLASMVSGGHAGKTLEEAGFRPEEAKKFLDTLKTWEQQYADENVGQAEGFWNTMAEIADNPSVVPHAVVESLPSMLAGGVFGRGLQALGVGIKAASAAGEGLVMAGSAAEGIRQQTKDGLLSLKQIAAAGGTGIMGAAVNRLGGGLSNRAGFGDLDEAIVRGALGVSTRAVVPRTVGAAGIEGGEELFQSSGEQVLQNYALDRPLDQGVGNAAAMGLVTGTAMGSVMGGAKGPEENTDPRYSTFEELMKQASDSGDVTALVDPASKTYNPQLGAKALLRYTEKPDLDPEVRKAKVEEMNQLVGSMQTRLARQKETLEEFKPESIEWMKTELESQKATLEQLDPADTETVESTQNTITKLERRIEARTGEGAEQRARNKVSKLEAELDMVRKFQDRMISKDVQSLEDKLDQLQEAPESVPAEQAEQTVSRMVTLAMQSPESVSDRALDYLIGSQSASITEPQRSYLRQVSASRKAENSLKDFGQVSDEIRVGSEKNKGIQGYRRWITAALGGASPDFKTAESELANLNNFTLGHRAKAVAFTQALKKVKDKGGSIQLVPLANGRWEPAETHMSMEELNKVDGFTITRASAARVNQIVEEAKALTALNKEMTSLYQLRRQGDNPQRPDVTEAPVTEADAVNETAEASEVAGSNASIESYVNHSGGAKGADSAWDSIGRRFGVTKHRHYQKDKTPLGNTSITPKQFQEGLIKAKEAAKMLGRNWSNKSYIQGLLSRNWQQVKNADAIFAIAEKLEGDFVSGGTGYAVAMARAEGKPVFVFDQSQGSWFRSSEKGWEQSPTPTLTPNFAGIGTRQLTAEGRQAIEDVYAKTKASLANPATVEDVAEVSGQDTVENQEGRDTSSESTQAGGNTVDPNPILDQENGVNDQTESAALPAEAGTQAAADTDMPTADQAPVVENVTPPASAGKGLSLYSEPDPELSADPLEDEKYRKLNNVKRFFSQHVGNARTGTLRPLVAMKDFLTQWRSGKGELERFTGIPLEELSEEQLGLLALIPRTFAAWLPQIQANFYKRERPEYFYTDYTQYFQDADGLVEENVKTAIAVAAFSHVVNKSGELLNSDAAINVLLGRDKKTLVTNKERAFGSRLGTGRDRVISELGQSAVQALGQQLKPGAPQSEKAKLEVALGTQALGLLFDRGIVEQKIITRGELARMKGENPEATIKQMRKQAKTKEDRAALQEFIRSQKDPINFIRFVADKNLVLSAEARTIRESTKQTGGLFDTLFSTNSGPKFPGFKPEKYDQKTAARSRKKVSSKARKALGKEAKAPHILFQDMWAVLGKLTPEQVLEATGVITEAQERVHISNRLGNDARNQGLMREWEHLVDFVNNNLAKKGLGALFYIMPEAWKNDRAGLKSSINPQTSKIHRAVMGKKSTQVVVRWTKKDQTALDNFKLRVAEGLGVKTGTQDNTKSLEEYKTRMEQPVFKEAVAALRKALLDGDLTPDEQLAIVQGVRKGKEDMHSLLALTSQAAYENAVAAGKQQFTTHVWAEVDGVNNGPMLAHVLMGAFSSLAEGWNTLAKGGFYPVGSKFSGFNQWRSQQGSTDLYETGAVGLMREVREYLKTRPENKSFYNAIFYVIGHPAKKGIPTPAGRKQLKGPVTKNGYGESPQKTVEGMSREFVQQVYDHIEDIARGESDLQLHSLLSATHFMLNSVSQDLADQLNVGMTIEEAMEFEFSDDQVDALKSTYQSTLGKQIEKTIEKQFAKITERRTAVNAAANLTFALYKPVYEAERRALIRELVDNGDLPVGAKDNPLVDLTREQEAQLYERLKDVAPILHTAMSKASGERDAGLIMAKAGKKQGDDGVYGGEIRFGNKEGKPQATLKATGFQKEDVPPGVSIGVSQTQSTDAAISITAGEMVDSTNVHDARIYSIKDVHEGALSLNKATFEQLLAYSPMDEMVDSLEQVIKQVTERLATSEDPQFEAEVKQALEDELHNLSPKQFEYIMANSAGLVSYRLETLKRQADAAAIMKLELMSTMGLVDQYSFEGGGFSVSPKDRERAAEALAARRLTVGESAVQDQAVELDYLSQGVVSRVGQAPATVEQVIDAINDEVESEFDTQEMEAETVASQWGELGSSRIKHEEPLVTFFEKNPEPGLKDVLKVLRGQIEGKPAGRSRDYSRALWKELVKHVNPDLKIVYVTPDTPMVEGIDVELAQSARGLYAFNETHDTLYIKSPAFVRSGIDTEMLLHELTHSVVARTIDMAEQGNPLPGTEGIIDELKILWERSLKEAAKDPKLASKHKIALSTLQEFVAWGMTNESFQREILNSFTIQTKTSRNKLVNAMKAFTNLIRDIIYRDSPKSAQQIQVTGLKTLFANVAGLMATAEQARTGVTSDLKTLAYEDAELSTMDIYESLIQADRPLDSEQDARLRNLIGSVMDRLQGPFGAMRADIQDIQATDPVDQVMQAQILGFLPFSTGAEAAGIDLNAQEVFALELAQLTFQESLEGENSRHIEGIRRALTQLYVEARKNPQLKQAMTPDQWNYVFQAHQQDQRSDYLARFASLAMVWQPLHDQMSFRTEKDTRRFTQMKLGEQIKWLWDQLVDLLQKGMFKVYAGQEANQKLDVLARRLVDLEYRKQNRRTGPVAAGREMLEDALDGMHEKTKEKVLKVLESPYLDQHKNALVRAGSAVSAAMVDGRLNEILDAGKRLRDRMSAGKLGFAAGVINEMREGNKVADLLLLGTKFLETVRMRVKDDTTKISLESFANKGKDLTKQAKDAVTRVMLRTDMQSLLGPFSLVQIADLLTNTANRKKAIRQFEQQLTGPFKDAYIQAAKQTAFMLVDSVKGHNTQQNALAIALRLNTKDDSKVSMEEGREIAKTLDPLISLYAIEYSSTSSRIEAAHVLRAELNRGEGEGNGVELILKLHRHLQQESGQKLFKDSELLMRKGYVPEVFNPHTEIVTAPAEDIERMEIQGYVHIGPLHQDSTDPVLKNIHLFQMKDRGPLDYQTGAVTLTGEHHKGTEAHAPLYSRNGKANPFAHRINRIITRQVQNQAVDPHYDPRKDDGVYMAPVLNAIGEVANYRYMMSEEMKDRLLQRNNSFDHLLGVMESNVFDKNTVTDQNRKVFEELKQMYDEDYTQNPEAYITFGPDSTDPEIRESWRKLPERSKQALKDVWGSDNLMVRNDIFDQTFGYSEYSLSKIMEMDEARRNFAEEMFFKLADYMVRWQLSREGYTGVALEDRAKRAALMIRRGEDRWKEVVKVVKDILVVKTGFTLLWNIVSNFTQLFLSGVSPIAMAKGTWEALRGVLNYRKDESELHGLQTLLASGTSPNEAETKQQIIRLQDTMARSPVAPLIKEGLLSSIVEDVDATESDFSYKSRWMENLERYSSRVPSSLRTVAKYAFVTHDTTLYKVLSQGTQVSDFTARYVLHQHLTTRKRNQLSHEDAVLKVSRAFINYDKPSHKMLDYANKMGLVYFTKYYLRIQHVIMDLAKENPARLLMLLTLDGYLDGAQTLVDSAAINQFGNPLDIGAFKMFDALEEHLPINAVMSMVR